MDKEKLFYVDELQNIYITYEQLFKEIKSAKEFHSSFISPSISKTLINLLVGLIKDLPITLIDNDITQTDIDKFELMEDKVYEVNLEEFNSIEDLLRNIRNSKSTIGIYSSGTTGVPKKVVHLASRFIRGTKIGEKFSKNTWAFAFSHTHMAGIQVFFQAILNSNSLINVFKYPKDSIVKQLKEYKVTHISASTTFYRLLQPEDFIVRSIQRATIGGEKSSKTIYEFIENVFPNAKITNIYASTEAGTVLVANGELFSVPNEKKGQVIVKDGELLLHKSLLGRFDNSQLIDKEWYRTGDIVETISVEPLQVKFISRKSKGINVGGINVFPVEVEDTLMEMEGILDARVYAKKNKLIGNLLMAEVIAPSFDKSYKRKIRAFLEQRLQGHKIPRIIEITDKLNLSRTGKKI